MAFSDHSGSERARGRRPTYFQALVLAVLLLGALILPRPCNAAPLTPAESAKVDQIVLDALAEVGTPSASVAVVREGRIVFAKTYGLARVETAERATVETRYRIASVSKQFTAAAVLMLADQGKLSLDDELTRFLPELGPANHATVRQALNHTAGFPDFWTVDYVTPEVERPTTPRAIVDQWGAAAADFAPGTHWAYSNTGYVVLGQLVERISGQPLGAFLQAQVFGPLQMTSAADVDGLEPGIGHARGYSRAAAGPLREAQRVGAGWTFGCGELSMTASDLARWDIGLLQRKLLSSAAYAVLTGEAKLSDGSGTGYGAGIFVDTVDGRRRFRHNGDLPGFWTENRIYPDDDAAVVVMVNGNFGGSPHAVIANGIERMLISQGSSKQSPSPVTPERMLGELFGQIRNDTLDRSTLSPNASAYLSGAVLKDYHDSFQRLGPALALIPVETSDERGVQAASWVAVWPTAKLMLSVRVGPDQKVEQFLAYPVWLKDSATMSSAMPVIAK